MVDVNRSNHGGGEGSEVCLCQPMNLRLPRSQIQNRGPEHQTPILEVFHDVFCRSPGRVSDHVIHSVSRTAHDPQFCHKQFMEQPLHPEASDLNESFPPGSHSEHTS